MNDRKLASSLIATIAALSDSGTVDWQRDVPRGMALDIARATIALRQGRYGDAIALADPALKMLRAIVARKQTNRYGWGRGEHMGHAD